VTTVNRFTAARKKLTRWFKRVIKDNLLLVLRYVGYPLVLGVNAWLRRRKLFVLYRLHGSAIGDTVVMTGVVRCIAEDLGCRVIVYVKQNDDIFLHNPHVLFCRSYEKMNRLEKTLIKSGLDILHGSHIAKYHPQMRDLEGYLLSHREHSIVTNSRHIPGLQYRTLRTEIAFDDEERERLGRVLALPPSYAVIKPTGKTSVTTKKEWGLENFQTLIDAFPDVVWVQPGAPDEPLLDGVIDLRGKTTLRELFYLIANARFTLAIEGLYNHIAGAFEPPSFVVYSGFSYREMTSYPNTVAIIQNQLPNCAPCFLDGLKDCPVPGKPCMGELTPGFAIDSIRRTLAQPAAH
jgi:hypothetical protein